MVAQILYDIHVVGHLHPGEGVKQVETRHLGRLPRIDADRDAAVVEKAHAAKVAVKQPEDERMSRLVLGGILQRRLEGAAVEFFMDRSN